MRNGLPLWLKLISCPNRNDSMVGYPPMPAPSHRPSRKLSTSRSGWIATPASGREHPYGQVQARHGGHGEHADHDRGAQHAVHNPQCTGEPTAPSGGAPSPRAARVSAMSERSLVIKVTAGKDDPERCNQAF